LCLEIKTDRFMANETNMYYRFTSDNEPKEEQLALLMQEAREEVRVKNLNLQSVIAENIQREYENIKKTFPNL
jgi:hypothetical protein